MATIGDLPSFSFTPSREHGSGEVVDQAYTAVVKYARTVIDWYLQEKEKKARASKTLGIGSIVLLVLGGVVPLLAPIVATINPSIGYILLALGGGLQLLDRYRGYSRSWSKHIASAITLNSALLTFQIQWNEHKALTVDNQVSWSILRDFAAVLGETISGETKAWSEHLEAETSALGDTFSAHRPATAVNGSGDKRRPAGTQ